MNNLVLHINAKDNVLIALVDLRPGDHLYFKGEKINILSEIPRGHKIALTDLDLGSDVIKYGYPIGKLKYPVKAGELINELNLVTSLSGLNNYTYNYNTTLLKDSNNDLLYFKGYRRKNGDVGIRNELWIIPTVGCVNGVVERLADSFRKETESKDIDSIVAYTHNYGCSQLGDDHYNTKKILLNMIQHPNAGGVLIVGLGCENNQISELVNELGSFDGSRIKFFSCQDVENEDTYGLSLLRDIYEEIRYDKRTLIPISELKIGLKCGGSDAFSGITANPLLGRFSDFLIMKGGSTVLTEVPEMFGAETILMNRCINEDIFNKTVSMINDFKTYFISNKQPIYENPSPGNKRGGISTLEEKSLGCIQKSGTMPVKDVLFYGDKLKTNGLSLLYSPGNDLVASTALASSGCHMVLFTTGRGTPFGTFVPTMKISSNTQLYERKKNWIDFDAGKILDGENIDKILERFVLFVISVASGEKLLNEKNLYRDFAIFKTGVTL